MDAISEHSFTVNLDSEDEIKPLPPLKRDRTKRDRTTLPNIYPKFEIEFYDVVKSCAEYIDKIQNTDTRIKYHKELSKIFVIRHKASAMRLFRELVNMALNKKDGDYRGQSNS
jgi:hypothetical protein